MGLHEKSNRETRKAEKKKLEGEKNMLPTLKIYDVDYSFIVKNYLDEKLWEKEWTIFIYKKFQITLRLHSIDVRGKVIYFEVAITDNNEENKAYWIKTVRGTFKYFINIEDIEILKQSLNHTIFCLMQRLECDVYIEYTENFLNIDKIKDEEIERLREIANNFLDDEGISNEDIREAYVERFIDNNESGYLLKNEYREKMKYRMITDFYIIFLEATQDKARLRIIKEKIGSQELEDMRKN